MPTHFPREVLSIWKSLIFKQFSWFVNGLTSRAFKRKKIFWYDGWVMPGEMSSSSLARYKKLEQFFAFRVWREHVFWEFRYMKVKMKSLCFNSFVKVKKKQKTNKIKAGFLNVSKLKTLRKSCFSLCIAYSEIRFCQLNLGKTLQAVLHVLSLQLSIQNGASNM